MANNANNEDFPTIRLDDEDRRDYQKKRQPVPAKAAPDNSSSPPPSKDKKSGGNAGWITVIALIALTACGGCYYLYTLLEQQKVAANDAEQRIAQLERKLSATGEEIGESTVALQVKVTELSNRTNELWEQMDKLWASAWRRNQQEIANLGDRISSTTTSLQGNITTVSDDVKAQNKEIGSVKNQLASFADEILALNVQLEQAAGDKQADQQKVSNLTDKLSLVEQRNASLSNRISSLESELRDIATKLVSRSGSGASGGAPPAATLEPQG